MTKKKESTDSYYLVTLEKTITVGATIRCKATARLDRTKRGLIANSADALSECIPESNWVDIDEGDPKVVDISKDNEDRGPKCPHCNKTVYERDITDLGEVAD